MVTRAPNFEASRTMQLITDCLLLKTSRASLKAPHADGPAVFIGLPRCGMGFEVSRVIHVLHSGSPELRQSNFSATGVRWLALPCSSHSPLEQRRLAGLGCELNAEHARATPHHFDVTRTYDSAVNTSLNSLGMAPRIGTYQLGTGFGEIAHSAIEQGRCCWATASCPVSQNARATRDTLVVFRVVLPRHDPCHPMIGSLI